MITINLDDDNVVENFKALNELRKTGAFTDKQLQVLYDKQVEADKEKINQVVIVVEVELVILVVEAV